MTLIKLRIFNVAKASFAEDQEKKDLMKELRRIYGMEDKVDIPF